MNDRERRQFLLDTAAFYRCPNSGEVIISVKPDDKSLCGCGQPNPKCVKSESGLRYGGQYYRFIGCHINAFLEPASVDDWMHQQDARTSRRAP